MDRADTAYDNEQWSEALTRYEEAFSDRGDGEVPPAAYARAARAATRAGNFSLAERYYHRALRNNAGPDVVKELAEFYLKTSKYNKAARILRSLLDSDLPKQPIYNNLGTALMYGGAPLDAESYLLVAQQMRPRDPYPYINLGLLYDRHLRHPALAVGFYQCFRKMAPNAPEVRSVNNRIDELQSQLSDDRPAVGVSCAEPYQPNQASSVAAIGKHMEGVRASRGRGEGNGGDAPTPVNMKTDGGKTYDLSTLEPVEESGSAQESADEETSSTQQKGQAEASSETTSAAVSNARTAFDNEQYRDVIDAMSSVEMSEMSPEAMGMYGIALGELGRNQKAVQWLDWSVQREPTPRRVEMLVTVHRRLKQPQEAKDVCDRFRGDDAYREALSNCPAGRVHDKQMLDKARENAGESSDGAK
jgi:tetratricopeptide (TPR) repeat protein